MSHELSSISRDSWRCEPRSLLKASSEPSGDQATSPIEPCLVENRCCGAALGFVMLSPEGLSFSIITAASGVELAPRLPLLASETSTLWVKRSRPKRMSMISRLVIRRGWPPPTSDQATAYRPPWGGVHKCCGLAPSEGRRAKWISSSPPPAPRRCSVSARITWLVVQAAEVAGMRPLAERGRVIAAGGG